MDFDQRSNLDRFQIELVWVSMIIGHPEQYAQQEEDTDEHARK